MRKVHECALGVNQEVTGHTSHERVCPCRVRSAMISGGSGRQNREPTKGALVLSRLGQWCHDHRRMVVVLWIVALVIANGAASSIGDAYRQDFTLPGFESTEGFELVEQSFDDGGGASAFSGQIVFESEAGVDDPGVEEAMTGLFDEVAELDNVTSVQSPYAEGGQFQISPDGTIAFATVN